MKIMRHIRPILTYTAILFLSVTLFAQKSHRKAGETFTFAFLTDIHLQPERNAIPGFTQAIDSVNRLNPDFVITGGDLIMDALGQRYSRADSLYTLYTSQIRQFRMPVYNTLGNHEIYGIYKKSGADPAHPEYGEKMFEKRLGPSYYAFDHKGWKFMILNSPEDTKKSSYIGLIDQPQMDWIKEELKKTDPATPIVISTHIPFITAYAQRYDASTTPNDSGLVVVNSKEVIDLFKGHNLKLVLQGHLHTVEDILVDNVRYITGGAVSGAWWKGPEKGYQEGFVLVRITGDEFTWRYADYGWEVKK
jgi:3',5'-cyclic AMP phosphodiesterase CpdA